jgi:hypothetical protein
VGELFRVVHSMQVEVVLVVLQRPLAIRHCCCSSLQWQVGSCYSGRWHMCSAVQLLVGLL